MLACHLNPNMLFGFYFGVICVSFSKRNLAAHASGCTAAEVAGDLHRSPLQVWLCVGLRVSFSLGNLG